MRRLPIALCLFLAASPSLASEPIPAPVRDHVTRLVEEGHVMGVVVGVVDAGGSSTFSRGLLAAGGPPVDEHTLFEIGSITKVFTAALLADMAGRGEVDLDTPLEKLLPAGTRMPGNGGAAITLADLATHRSALPRLPDAFEPPDGENPYAAYREADLLAFLAAHRLEREVGARYEYSNLGAGLLGYALARRAARTYEDAIIERIAAPLGMVDTRVTLSSQQASRLARGHLGGQPVAGWDFDALAGAGALRSTAGDMLRFLAANLGLEEEARLPALAATHAGRHETGVPDLAVALGWHVWDKHGATLLWHNGGTGGYRSFSGFDPQRRRGVVVLANSGDAAIDDLGLHLLEPGFELAELGSPTPLDPAALEELAGFYELAPGVVFHVTREGVQLFAQLTGQQRFPVYPQAPGEFSYKVVDARLAFHRDEEGKVDRLVLHQNGEHTARRLAGYRAPVHVEVPVDPGLLARYVGKYELAPGVLFDVALQGEGLAIQLADQPQLRVYPESENRFFYKAVEAQVTFVVEDSGEVTGLVLHQGGIDQTARKIE
jgi:serine-type D-Ala-D-Ala carboxypeptidase/endopeptidase